ncbi:MAG: glycosyltransferase, partial [Candidatus Moranbacteria bacterium]|nr:glycosyltransferase [Candidatus Moranbacteria bacterium]
YQAGTENYTHYIAEAMADLGHEVFIVATEPESDNNYHIEKYEEGRVKVFKIHKNIAVGRGINSDHTDEKYLEAFVGIIDEINPDIAHIQHLLYSSHRILDVMKERKIPIIYTLHDSWLECPKITKLMPDNSMCSGWSEEKCRDCISSSKIYISNDKMASLLSKIYGKFSMHRIFVNMVSIIKKILTWFGTGKKSAESDIKARYENMKKIIDSVNLFISPSQYLRSAFASWGIPEDKIIYSRNGMNVFEEDDIKESEEKSDGGELVFAFTSFIREAKGVHILLDAFEILEKGRIKGGKLLVYGRYEKNSKYAIDFLRKIRKLKTAQYMGEFNNKEINSILKKVDYLVLPSIWSENAPLVIEEAYLNKVPCIVSDIGGMAERVEDGKNGLHFKAGNAKDLAEKISYLLNKKEIRNIFIKNIPHVKTIKENAVELEDLYKKYL